MAPLQKSTASHAREVPLGPRAVKAKSRRFPRCSAALSHFLFEALYRTGEGQANSNEAADLAFELMARDGHRSWREMLAVNATMTLEHWYGVIMEKHTWAHPWAAGPATHIVRRVFGVRPLGMGAFARTCKSPCALVLSVAL